MQFAFEAVMHHHNVNAAVRWYGMNECQLKVLCLNIVYDCEVRKVLAINHHSPTRVRS